MTRLRDRALFVTLAPLALALAALGVREATRVRAHEPKTPAPATEFVPPDLFLAASAAPGRDQTLSVVADRSSGRVGSLDGDAARGEDGLRAGGKLRILADESLADLEIDLASRADAHVDDSPRDVALHLRGSGARSVATAVPGVRACALRCTVAVGADVRETSLAITWIRLPGGLVELHAVAEFERAGSESARSWFSRKLHGEEKSVLGIDLVLRADR